MLLILGAVFSEHIIGSSSVFFFMFLAYGLLTSVPGWAVTVRRLHDTNRSGWTILLQLIPYIGGIIFIIFLALNGNSGSNYYGPDPKEIKESVPESAIS